MDAIAYADDLILLADTPKLMDARLKGLDGALKDRDMSLDTSKSAAITITKDKKRGSVLFHYQGHARHQVALSSLWELMTTRNTWASTLAGKDDCNQSPPKS